MLEQLSLAPALLAASSSAGQLGTVGRQLGVILASIVQQLRNKKMRWGTGMTKVYELVFGKVVGASCPGCSLYLRM